MQADTNNLWVHAMEVKASVGLIAVPDTCRLPGSVEVLAFLRAKNLYLLCRGSAFGQQALDEADSCLKTGDHELHGTHLGDHGAALEIWGSGWLTSEGYIPQEYVVTFSYSADGQTFKGTYRTNSPQECGHDFEILYDPKHPHKNTGSDGLNKRWVRMIAVALGVITVLVAIWFWGKEDWFQW